MKSAYANVCNVSSTGRSRPHFRVNQACSGAGEVVIQLTDRLILSPFAANGCPAPPRVMREYETRFGELPVEPHRARLNRPSGPPAIPCCADRGEWREIRSLSRGAADLSRPTGFLLLFSASRFANARSPGSVLHHFSHGEPSCRSSRNLQFCVPTPARFGAASTTRRASA